MFISSPIAVAAPAEVTKAPHMELICNLTLGQNYAWITGLTNSTILLGAKNNNTLVKYDISRGQVRKIF